MSTPYFFPQLFQLPFYSCYISAGFPSPAFDDIGEEIDLNRYLIKHAPATFLFKMKGKAMEGAGIFASSVLIVDRSLEAKNGKIVVAEYNGELVVRRYYKDTKITKLLSENKNYPVLDSSKTSSILIWGVVTSIITQV